MASSPPTGQAVRAAIGLKARVNLTLRSAVVTKPVAIWHFLQIDTVGVPQLLTAITIHQHILIVIFSASLTRLVLLVFFGNLKEHGRIKVGDLGTFFNRV